MWWIARTSFAARLEARPTASIPGSSMARQSKSIARPAACQDTVKTVCKVPKHSFRPHLERTPQTMSTATQAFNPDAIGIWGEPVKCPADADRIAAYAAATND